MAETLPPDNDRRAGTQRSSKSGKVADFRYKRSSRPKRDGKPSRKDCEAEPVADFRRSRAKADADQSKPQPKDQPQPQPKPSSGQSTPDQPRSPFKSAPAPRRSNSARPGEAYAALDLGTNNCRLLIARPSGRDFTVIDAFSRVVKLGEDLATTGRLSDRAMDRALGALSICADKLRRRKVRLARSVATEACRRAANGPAFIERVRQETGIVLDIITAEEEARLAVLGCHILLEQGDGPAVIFDIGGGSTELVLLAPPEPGKRKVPRILDWQSVPWGVVSLTDTVGECGDTDAARLAMYERMRGIVADSFAPFARRIGTAAKQEDIRLLGTSGTVTTLASLHLELPHYDRKAVDGLIVPSAAMRAISSDLSEMSRRQRSDLPCIGQDRADLVVAGCAILEAILDLWPAQRLGVADRGIREGILRSLMAAERQSERALEALQASRTNPQQG
ncbi:MAG: Ppx/GppA phosphatase family protein [Pseudomonadota bacterium]